MSRPLTAIGIQCRLTSSRLPCKALLKLADTTVLGMCIQRAKHSAHPVFLLTSNQQEDDILVNAILKCGADGIIRGSLDNVLSRYLMLSQAFPCEYIIRVTADNPLTEYEFVNPLIDFAHINNLSYAWVEPSLCPEGTNIEIFSTKALLESVNTDNSSSNLEHVTTFMRRNLSSRQFLKDVASERFPFDCKQLSFTIDTVSDYVKMVKLIDSVNQQQGIHWNDRNFVRICAEYALNKHSSYPLGRNHAIS